MNEFTTAKIESPKKTVRLPFEFGEIVYHRLSDDKEPGMVTGYILRVNGAMSIFVTWANCQETSHYFYELTTEFKPFSSE